MGVLPLFPELVENLDQSKAQRKISRTQTCQHISEAEQIIFSEVKSFMCEKDRQLAIQAWHDRIAESEAEWPSHTVDPDNARQLWIAIIDRAVSDAVHLDMLICNDDDGEDAEQCQISGIEWFRAGGEALDDVCFNAGFDPHWVRGIMKRSLIDCRIINEDWSLNPEFMGISRGALHDSTRTRVDLLLAILRKARRQARNDADGGTNLAEVV